MKFSSSSDGSARQLSIVSAGGTHAKVHRSASPERQGLHRSRRAVKASQYMVLAAASVSATTALLRTTPARSATYTFTSTASNAPWLTTTNWNLSGGATNGHYPGAANKSSSANGSSSDIALFTVNPAAVGINMNTLAGGLTLGAIDFESTATSLSLSDSSTTVPGTVTLNGATINSVANTIIADLGTKNLTFATGTQAMNLSVGSTANVIQVANGNTTTLNWPIYETNSGSAITFVGNTSGTLVFGGSNSYTGGTTITGGSLFVNNTTGSGTGSGSVSVAAASTLGGTGTIAGAVANSGILSPGASSARTAATLSIGGGLSFNSGSSATFDLGGSGTSYLSDKIAVTGDLTLPSSSNTVTLNFNSLDAGIAYSLSQSHTYNLITYTGSLIGGFGAFQVGTTGAPAADTFTLIPNANSVDLMITASASPRTLTWDPSGAAGTAVDGTGSWDTTTFHWLDGSGNPTTFSSIAPDNAVFGTGSGAGTSYTSTIAAGGVTAGAVTFTAGSPTYTIAGAPLTLASSLSNGVAVGFVANTSANVTANVALAAPQTWSAASGQTLSVSGAVSGSFGLIIGGAGTTALTSTTSSYTGGTNVTNGSTLQIASDGSLGASTGGLIVNGGTLQLLGTVAASGRGFTFGTSGTTIDTNGFNAGFSGAVTGSTTTPLTKLPTAGDIAFTIPASATIGLLTVGAGGSVTFDTSLTSNPFFQFGTTTAASVINGTLNVGTGTAHTLLAEVISGDAVDGTGTLNIAPGSALNLFSSNTAATTVGPNLKISVNTTGGVNSVIGAVNAKGVLTVSGSITGSGGVSFGGTSGTSSTLFGKVVLTGSNNYSGGTLINAGTVVANSSSGALGTGTVAIGVFTNVAGTANTASGTLAGNGTFGAPVVIRAGGTITAGSGAAANDSIGVLTTTSTHTWNTGGIYTVKLNTGISTPAMFNGASGAPGTANDELVLSGLTASTGLTINPIALSPATGSLTPYAQYSYVIAHDTVATKPTDATAFDGLLLTNITFSTSNVGTYSVSSAPDGTGGEYLFLDVIAAPEPTSLLLMGMAAAPLALSRRRRPNRSLTLAG